MIPYGKQSIEQNDIDAVIAALKSDFLTTGPLVEIFEGELEKAVGAPCISVSSGTAALHCAYAALELQPGDEVITPPITFIATQATASFFGAKIVFSDVLDGTGNIDPNYVETLVNDRTKAIVAVDYAGHPADLSELRKIADRYGIFLVEDAAHAIGSTYRSRNIGSIADITTFSFFPTKNMTTAEGGAVASINPELLDKARKFSRQGLVRDKSKFKILNEGSWHQEVQNFGLNYRLPDVLCALGISQIQKLSNNKIFRKELFIKYGEFLGNIPDIVLPEWKEYVDPMWHLYHLHVNPENRRAIFDKFRKAGIGVQVNYLPAYRHPVFSNQGINPADFPVSESFYKSEISLPMWVNPDLMQDSYFEKVKSILEEF